MGVSTDAILCWGIDLEEGEAVPGVRDEYYLKDMMVRWVAGDQEVSIDRRFAILEQAPLEVVLHCSLQSTMYIVAVRRTVTTAWRGYPQVIDPATMVITEEERAALRRFTEEVGLQNPAEPRWLLASFKG